MRGERSVALQGGDGVDDDPVHLLFGGAQPGEHGDPVGFGSVGAGGVVQRGEPIAKEVTPFCTLLWPVMPRF